MVILGCLPHSQTMYRHVRGKLDRHFDHNPTTNNFPIGSPFRNGDFGLSPTLTLYRHVREKLDCQCASTYSLHIHVHHIYRAYSIHSVYVMYGQPITLPTAEEPSFPYRNCVETMSYVQPTYSRTLCTQYIQCT